MSSRLSRFNTYILAAGLAIVGCLAPVSVMAATQANPIDASCAQKDANTPSAICQSKGQKLFGVGSIWTNIVNTMILVVSAVAVVMVVIGGLRYTLSGGDQGAIKSAKDTILYAIVGLVVAAFAYTIVNFVLTKL